MRIRTPALLLWPLLLLATACGDQGVTTPAADTAPPTITLDSPGIRTAGYSLVSESQAMFRGTASDDVAVTRMTYSLNGAAEQDISVSPGPNVTFEFTIPALAPGANIVVISASDAAGNRQDLSRHVSYAVVRYKVVTTADFADGGSRARGINSAGDMTVQRDRPDGSRPYVWSDTGLTELVVPEGHVLMSVLGINSARVAVGDLEDTGTGAGDWRDVPVVWVNGQPTVLPLLPGFTMGGAVAINDAGIIAGYVMDQTWDNWAAVVWTAGQPTRLSMPGGGSAWASDINSGGVLTGSYSAGSAERAFRWNAGQVETLQPLQGFAASAGLALNDGGDVVGFSYNATSNITRATMWRGTVAVSLGEFPGGRYYRAWGVNNQLQAVGGVDSEGQGVRRAAFISEDGRMSLLSHLTSEGWEIIEAMAINDAGQIAAIAVHSTGGFRTYAVRLDPVDPAAVAMSDRVLPQALGARGVAGTIGNRLRPGSPLEWLRGGRVAR
jgi:uncharacterized membrane protein